MIRCAHVCVCVSEREFAMTLFSCRARGYQAVPRMWIGDADS